ncbi:hypothetical protein GCM10009539_76250 [Cryptosporangium japonicum]|uniref:Major facilitator superfamily (MFS) profile domain-containing protein n=1 Tax=Cryptosporangium japonicum TaxID=80872 RepID=A0ABP3ESX6_9ACTN
MLDLRLFGRPGFSASVVVAGLCGAATFASLAALPLYHQLVRGLGASAAGLLLAPLGLGSAMAMPIAGRLSDRLGSRRLVPIGGGVAAAAALSLTTVSADVPPALPALQAFVLGAALGGVGAPTIGSVYRTLPPPLVPPGSSALSMLNQLGASLGIASVALVVQTADTPLAGTHRVHAGLTGALLLLLAAAAVIPGRPSPARPEPVAADRPATHPC